MRFNLISLISILEQYLKLIQTLCHFTHFTKTNGTEYHILITMDLFLSKTQTPGFYYLGIFKSISNITVF